MKTLRDYYGGDVCDVVSKATIVDDGRYFGDIDGASLDGVETNQPACCIVGALNLTYATKHPERVDRGIHNVLSVRSDYAAREFIYGRPWPHEAMRVAAAFFDLDGEAFHDCSALLRYTISTWDASTREGRQAMLDELRTSEGATT